jgi:DNA-binding beta-propeller fold protein YncE
MPDFTASTQHVYDGHAPNAVNYVTPSDRSRGRVRHSLRAALTFMSALLIPAICAHAETEIRSLTGIMEGHEVGGVTVDMIGNIYAADFGDIVWRFTPEGQRSEFAAGMYGTSGNAIDNEGNLLQSSFYGDAVTRIDRKGQATPLVTRGLSRPVGIAVNRQTGDVYVANCRSNSVVRLTSGGDAVPFAKSELFKCPYGMSVDREGNLYAVNFEDNRMLKIDPKGAVALFATVSQKGLGHLCFKNNRFYVTAFWSHEIYEVTLDKKVKRILGNGERGIVDGAGTKARLSFPHGIGCHPWAPRIYVNEDVNESGAVLPRRSMIRVITPEATQ